MLETKSNAVITISSPWWPQLACVPMRGFTINVNPPPVPPSLNPYLGFTSIRKLFSQDPVLEQQILGFTGLTITIAFTKKGGKMLGTTLPNHLDLFQKL